MSLARHFMTIISGRLLSQVILVLSTPILTRIYGPEDFGVVSLVASITQVPMILLMGRLDHALPQSRDDAEAGQIATLCILWAAMMTILCGALAWGMSDALAQRYKEPLLPSILLVSIGFFLPTAFSQLGRQWASYRERHGVTASADVLLTAVRRLTPIPLAGWLGVGPWSLFIGQATGVVASALTFGAQLGRDMLAHLTIRPRALWDTLVRYRSYPLFLSGSSLFEVLAWSVLSLLLGDYFGIKAVGLFGQAYALLYLPISLLNQSANSVFYPRLARARDRDDRAELRGLLRNMTTLSFDLCWFPMLALMPLAPTFWRVMLGEAFATSGEIAQVLIPMSIANVIYSPVSVGVHIFKQQRSIFWQSLALNVGRVGALALSCALGADLITALGAYTLVTVLFKIGQLRWMLGFAELKLSDVSAGLSSKLAYTVVCVGGIWALESLDSPLMTTLAFVVASLSCVGWLALIARHNPEARKLVSALLSRFRGR